MENKKTPLQVASDSDVNVNQKHYHTFGCPTYVLNSNLQQGQPFGKWDNQAEVGIYIYIYIYWSFSLPQ